MKPNSILYLCFTFNKSIRFKNYLLSISIYKSYSLLSMFSLLIHYYATIDEVVSCTGLDETNSFIASYN